MTAIFRIVRFILAEGKTLTTGDLKGGLKAIVSTTELRKNRYDL